MRINLANGSSIRIETYEDGDVQSIHYDDPNGHEECMWADSEFLELNPTEMLAMFANILTVAEERYATLPKRKYHMSVDTDWDFGISYKGKVYSDSSFSIFFDSVEELDEIELLGPFGSPGPPNHRFEFDEAIKEIKANPDEDFCNQGGNRGVHWTVNDGC